MTSSIASLLMVLALWLSIVILGCAGGAFEKPLSAGERAEALRGKETGCKTMERLKSAGALTKVEQSQVRSTVAESDTDHADQRSVVQSALPQPLLRYPVSA